MQSNKFEQAKSDFKFLKRAVNNKKEKKVDVNN